MDTITRAIKPVMLVSGLITGTMLYAALAPVTAIQSMFGEVPTEPLVELLVRNWGALVTLIGFALIYGAFRPHVRTLVLVLGIISKIWFVALVIGYGYASSPAGMAIWLDIVFVALFLAFLVSGTKKPALPN